MTAEEKANLQAGLKEAMAKTREENLKYIKEHNLGGMIAAREGLDKLKEKAGGIASEIKDNFVMRNEVEKMNKPDKWGDEEWKKFEEFDSSINRSAMNDCDEERWYDFVATSHDSNSNIMGEDVENVMRTRGWNSERCDKYALRYEDERALLRRYQATHLVMAI